MKERYQLLVNIILFLGTALFLAILQSAIWFQFFGSFPPPLFWLPPLIYLSLYRHPREGLLVAYLILFTLTTLTGIHVGFLLLSFLWVYTGIIMFKTRVFTTGPRYFCLVNGSAALALPIVQYTLSFVFEEQAIANPEIGSWILSAILTPIPAYPLYKLLTFFDRVTDKEQLIETREERIL